MGLSPIYGFLIDNTPWEKVVENEMYLFRHELTLQKIKALNRKVIYDGN